MRLEIFKPLSTKAGFTLIDLIIATAISSGLALGFGATFVMVANMKQEMQSTSNILATRVLISEALFNPLVRQNNIAAGQTTVFSCLSDFSTCPASQEVHLIGPSGAPIPYVQAPAAVANGVYQGLNYDGSTCTSSNVVASTDCPIRLRASWQPSCAVPCVSPQIIWKIDVDTFQSAQQTGLARRRDNKYSISFRNNHTPNLPVPIDISASYNSCVLMSNSEVKCWGHNSNGSLGNGTLIDSGVPVSVLSGPGVPLNNVTKIITAQGSMCALLTGGSVTCWGENQYGQGGTGVLPNNIMSPMPNASGTEANDLNITYANRPVRNATGTGDLTGVSNVYATENSFCARVAGNFYCWGGAGRGMGPATLKYMSVPNYLGDWHEGAEPWGGYLNSWTYSLPGLVDPTLLPPTADIIEMFAENHNICIVFGPNRELTCWGARTFGKLATDESIAWGTQQGAPPDLNRRIPAVGQPLLPIGTNYVNTLQNVETVAISNRAMCASRVDRSVVCWGLNQHGATGLGLSTADSNISAPNVVVDTNGTGALSDIVSVHAGDQYFCGLSGLGDVYCWGFNSLGQLGDGTTTSRSVPARVMVPGRVSKLAVGPDHTCAFTTDAQVYCWGSNARGEIGNGTIGGSVPYPQRVVFN